MEAIPMQGIAPGVEPMHIQLRRMRRDAGLSQNEIARQLGMDVLEYCRLESGVGEIDEGLMCKVKALRNR